MNLELKKIPLKEIDFFQQKMVESFQSGVMERFGDLSAAPIPPEDDLSRCSQNINCDLWAIVLDGVPAGAAVIEKNGETGRYSLDLLFIFKEFINKKIGSKSWRLIESAYPEAKVWETHTPYFERRNIHFYINRCGFKIVEFFNEVHREEHDLTDEFKDINTSGFFRFEKVMS
ncbi:MAG: GNAT family N-acetyltransferase [Lentisphaeria bacterium]|nr:GNAT family N-acetyltransferase [Lentisphaeria bacterium]